MIINLKYCTKLIIALLFCSSLFGQTRDAKYLGSYYSSLHYKFERLSTENGLPQSTVVCILKDSKGFMWFGTYTGLSRYDGKNFKNFFHRPKDPYSLSINTIWSLAEGPDGNIWVGTWNGGLNRYLVRENRFEHFRNDPEDSLSVASDIIRCLFVSSKKDLWIGTESGLSLFNPAKKSFANYEVHNQPELLSHNKVLSMYEDDSGMLWLGTEGGLVKFDMFNKKIIKEFRNISNHPDVITYNAINDIAVDKEGKLWLATWGGGLHCFDPKTEKIDNYWHDPYNSNSISNNIIMNLLFDKDGRLWLGTRGTGIDIFDIAKNKFEHIKRNPSNPNSLSNDAIYTFYNDNNKIIWVGTDYGGVNKYDLNKKAFRSYRYAPSVENGLKTEIPAILYEDSKKNLWIGGRGQFEKFDRARNIFQKYRFKFKNTFFESGNITALQEDFDGTLWIGSDGGGLIHFDPETGYSKSYTYNPNDTASLSQDFIYSILLDKNNTLWIGTQNNGISLYDRENDNFTSLVHNENKKGSLPGNRIKILYQDSKKNIWIGTDLKGVAKYDFETQKFISYLHNKNNPNSLTGNYINAILEDKNGNLWIGTNNSGISIFEPKTDNFKTISEFDGLSSNTILGILEDDSKNIWISTTKGLNRIDHTTYNITQYYKDNGLLDHEFKFRSFMKSESGELLFGVKGGIVVFHPDEIVPNSAPPAVELLDVKLFNKSIPVGKMEDGRVILNKTITYTNSITLDYIDKVLTISYAALDYVSPDKNTYAYKLVGFDDEEAEWTEVGNETSVTYTNLEPGEYIFIVKAANSDGVWNNEGRKLKIIVKPPFWMTWWFRTLIILLFGALVYAYIRWRIYSFKKRSMELETIVNVRTFELRELNEELKRNNELLKFRQIKIEEQADELHQQKENLQKVNAELNKSNATKDKLFSIISHDVRSPFSAVVGFSELIIKKFDIWDKDKKKEHLKHIVSAARKVYSLLDNLLIWSRTQQQAFKFKPEWFSLKDEIEKSVEVLKENAEQKVIEIKNCAECDKDIYGDKNMIRIVLQNLISNAIKFTKEKGLVKIDGVKENGNWLIAVKDNGVGIPEESKKEIFCEDVYSTKGTNKEEGTGLGLVICKEFVQAHNGKIWFESEENKGTTFYFTIPVVDENN